EGPSRKVRGNGLGDHAPHRGADDVGLLDARRVQQADSIPGHVTDRVRRRCRLARRERLGDRLPIGRAGGIELRREADVAVVEDDDPVAPLHQLLAEFDGPLGELAVRAHDQQDGLAILGAEALVGDRDAVRLDLALADRDAGSLGPWWFVSSPGRAAEQDTCRDQAEERYNRGPAGFLELVNLHSRSLDSTGLNWGTSTLARTTWFLHATSSTKLRSPTAIIPRWELAAGPNSCSGEAAI